MLQINFTETDFAIADLGNRVWNNANSVAINKYWSAETAPSARHAAARLLWSEKFLYVRFDCVQKEPLIINAEPDTRKKTLGLWERDVCEIFVAPDTENIGRYFEFEVAPTGEWVDLEIHKNGDERETLVGYNSQMDSAAEILKNRIIIGVKSPFEAITRAPRDRDVWRGNLFRIVGEGNDRGFLAWKPTMSAEPNFHVPGKFGEFRFIR